ncbi:DUF3180 domain-containing protein [Gordonia zhaorongruii]|uniref:DUF3180 domain-containing protein n=1 Tax=Gordonia zhaorongruii TaxID=2597659 RepID=UPI00104B000B|nr:DUF3180 domain-containing protein [Gordonia zhaorongruii]
MTAPRGGQQSPEDDGRLHVTRVRDLIAIAVVAGLALWILIRYNYGEFPSLPWPASVVLYLLAAIEVGIGFYVRSRVSDQGVGPALSQLHPITVARTMVLGKASAILGAVAAGGWTGVLIFLLDNGLLDAARADRPAAIVGAAGGVVLVVASLWLEFCCRAPDDPTDDAQTPDAYPA